tara:strand:+ start:1295 stop:1603 length:309 start_codon:yes stop_codon:yes gene_type:complete
MIFTLRENAVQISVLLTLCIVRKTIFVQALFLMTQITNAVVKPQTALSTTLHLWVYFLVVTIRAMTPFAKRYLKFQIVVREPDSVLNLILATKGICNQACIA